MELSKYEKLIHHHAKRLNESTLMCYEDAVEFMYDVVGNTLEVAQTKTKIEYCKCEVPQPNYPEMVWCDICGKQIKD